MATKASRAGALGLAALFTVMTLGGTGLVIYQVRENKKQQDAIDKAVASSSQGQSETQSQTKEGALQGTQLADFTPVETVDSLQAIDTVEGTGEAVKAGDTITAHYTGAVAATGEVFQSSHDSGQPVQFSLNGVIQGWSQGVPGMKVGGKRRLLIPAGLAYGANPPQGSGIPINAALVFDIELVSIDMQ